MQKNKERKRIEIEDGHLLKNVYFVTKLRKYLTNIVNKSIRFFDLQICP